MTEYINIKKSLINVNHSILVIIDIQDSFLEKYSDTVSIPLLEKTVWILKIAKQLNIPVVAMAEDIEHAGTLNQNILDGLPKATKIHNKDSFGLADQPEILVDINTTGRKTAVLVGVETNVCVAQSALGLMENGYHAVVLKDAVATTAGDDDVGLNRMSEAGAVISSVKAIVYEWLRSVSYSVEVYERDPSIENDIPDCLAL